MARITHQKVVRSRPLDYNIWEKVKITPTGGDKVLYGTVLNNTDIPSNINNISIFSNWFLRFRINCMF